MHMVKHVGLQISHIKISSKHLACVLKHFYACLPQFLNLSAGSLLVWPKHWAAAPYRSSLNPWNNKFQDNTAQPD